MLKIDHNKVLAVTTESQRRLTIDYSSDVRLNLPQASRGKLNSTLTNTGNYPRLFKISGSWCENDDQSIITVILPRINYSDDFIVLVRYQPPYAPTLPAQAARLPCLEPLQRSQRVKDCIVN